MAASSPDKDLILAILEDVHYLLDEYAKGRIGQRTWHKENESSKGFEWRDTAKHEGKIMEAERNALQVPQFVRVVIDKIEGF